MVRGLLCLLSAVCVAAVAAGCPADAKKGKGRGGPGFGPTLVDVATARAGALTDRWSFLGDVRAVMRAELAAGATGAVTRVLVREGDAIRKGALLLTVDSALAVARLRRAQAEETRATEQVAQAKREAARLDRVGREATSGLARERAQSGLQTAKADRSAKKAATLEARALLARHKIRAPFDGVLATRRVDPGDWVTPGKGVLDLVSTAELEIALDVSPRLLQFVAPGVKARISAGANRGNAVVKGVVGALDPVARTARLRLSPADGVSWLRSGMAVRVAFAIRHEGGAGVVVSRDALIIAPGAGGTRVITVVGGKARPVAVEVIATAATDALVVAQAGATLRAGDNVVVRGNERLRPGQAVRVAGKASGKRAR